MSRVTHGSPPLESFLPMKQFSGLVLTDIRNAFSFDTIDAQMIISGSIDEKESLKEENVQESSA